MYSVSRQKHSKYGSVVAIERGEEGAYLSPFAAVNQARHIRWLWLQEGEVKVRVLVDSQVMTVLQAERWSREEYRHLPKCTECAKILSGQVYTHRLCISGLFCSQYCADQSYRQEIDKINDEEEIDYL